MTLEDLRAFGANTADGLARCYNDEGFYLRLVRMLAEDGGAARLRQALNAGEHDAALLAAHSLKEAAANLGLTPLEAAAAALIDALQAGEDAAALDALCGRVEALVQQLSARE